jgi:hypothetical protein
MVQELQSTGIESKCSVEKERKLMKQYKIICPECSAAIVTNNPEAMIWERCPQCRRHIWEADDLMMSELVIDRSSAHKKSGNMVRSHNH